MKAEPGTSYTVIGILKSLRTHIDKKGNEMAFGSLQDQWGEIDVVFFARNWENCKALAAVDEMLAFKGTLDLSRDKNPGSSGSHPAKPSFVVSSIQDLNKLVRAAAKKAAELSGEASPPEVSEKTETASQYREIHIRLTALATDNDEQLHSLKACMEGNPGTCPVYIHIPVFSSGGSEETVIRTAGKINASVPASIGALAECAAVAHVWGS